MEVKQIYELVNEATKATLGETAVLNEDLSNLVDVGTAIFNANQVDNYVRTLIDRIGRVVFVNREYKGFAPSVLMDAWEYGSILEKIRTELPEATVNEGWQLVKGTSVDPNVFNPPVIRSKFYNNKVTFEVDVSLTEMQVKESFTNATQLNAFISMIFTSIENSMTIKLDALIMRTIDNMIADTIHSEYGSAALNSKSGVKAVNLLYLYNKERGTALTAKQALVNKEFLRFASEKLSNYIDYISSASKLFNMGKTDKYTPKDLLHVVMLSSFEKSATFNMESDSFHNQLVSLPYAETVPYWQGSGMSFDFDDVSKVVIKSSSGNMINTGGILAVLFDNNALGVSNMNRRVKTNYNSKGEFMNYFYKYDAGYFNDGDENFVVFFVA